jgi:hypothetical protein
MATVGNATSRSAIRPGKDSHSERDWLEEVDSTRRVRK